jgi:hypothetical protein
LLFLEDSRVESEREGGKRDERAMTSEVRRWWQRRGEGEGEKIRRAQTSCEQDEGMEERLGPRGREKAREVRRNRFYRPSFSPDGASDSLTVYLDGLISPCALH